MSQMTKRALVASLKDLLAEKTRLSARLRIRIRPGGSTQSGGVGRRGCR